MVPQVRLELTYLSEQVPKTCASTNCATGAKINKSINRIMGAHQSFPISNRTRYIFLKIKDNRFKAVNFWLPKIILLILGNFYCELTEFL